MRKGSFETWLKTERERRLVPGTIASRISNCERGREGRG